jgi:NADP-reducing hydrogenase subunit HndD
MDFKKERAKALYAEDRDAPHRKSHENPTIKKLYLEYFGQPGSERAHELLHTVYQQRENYPSE